jgi:hypothetical protein
MILFRILKLFGVDVPARIAQVQAKFEQRVEIAKDQVRHAAQKAGVVAALSALAGIAVLAAAGVSLIALYRWVLINYGQFYGLAAVGGVLILIAIILFAAAILEVKSWSAARPAANKDQHLEPAAAEPDARPDRAAAALAEPGSTPLLSPQPEHAPTSAADLVAPLSLILSRVMKFPTTGNPALDELLFELRGSARGVADEAVDGVVRAVRYGDRTKLVAALSTAVLLGWLLARHRSDHVRSD